MDVGPLKAANACEFCRKRKRSCDRLLPKCSKCASKDLACDYSGIGIQGVSSQDHSKGVGQDGHSLHPTVSTPEFPPAYFMDHQFFQDTQGQLPAIQFNTSVLDYVNAFVANSPAITTEYFRKIHWWMPIISKKRLADHMTPAPFQNPGADVLLLRLTMKMLLWNPSQHPRPDGAKSQEYMIAKHAMSDSLSIGILTLPLLQAQFLIAIYELGHAIYPAAYLSIGACARCGVALGVDKALRLDSQTSPYDVIELEERRRTWWAILVLDRYMQLGSPTQALSTEDPDPQSLLPFDDQDFDQGNLPLKQFSVSDAASVKMGMLARMAQSAYLLGRVHHHKRYPPADESDRRAELWQLDRTLHALLKLTYVEGAFRRMAVCSQTSICYSALIVLHNSEHNHMALDLLKPVTDSMVSDSQIFLNGILVSVEDASPMLLFWAYQAGSIYNRLAAQDDSDALMPLVEMKEKLVIMSRRWKAGDVYLQMLKIKEAKRLEALAA